ncbi:vesicle-associated membrane protein 2-like [Cyprinus carpio]|uniref:Vesicle-associated membrane protein 2-like n=1 Tax=Cyprinus carpio TaxID=7962 RepID=A0A9Q9XHI0_CYPCA|nr:vesicle-associated membrane protein 2-like [Cyprinus carpio]
MPSNAQIFAQTQIDSLVHPVTRPVVQRKHQRPQNNGLSQPLSLIPSVCPRRHASSGAPGAPEGEGGQPNQPPNLSSNRRLQQTQAQVDEVVDIMRVNVDKVLERDQKLSELDDRADALQAGASQFESSAAKLKKQVNWWKGN